MGANANITDIKTGSLDTKNGGIMGQLEARLLDLGPDRFEAFLEWISTQQWGSKPLHLVRFKGAKVKTSITVSDTLLEAAKQQAAAQGFTHGISTLLEYLLWDFLGKPEELVDSEPKPKKKDEILGSSESTFSTSGA